MEAVHYHFEDRDSQSDTLALLVAAQLRAAIAERHEASLVVSGGSTPLAMFRRLSQADLDWSKVTVTLADERWVPASHADSNTAMVRANLLRDKAAAATFLPLYREAGSVEEGIEASNTHIKDVAGTWDLVILGMGDDGHTASLFPCAAPDELAAGLGGGDSGAEACVIMHPGQAPHTRITQTLPRLLDSRKLILHIAGQSKLDVLRAALGGQSVADMPIRAFLQQDSVPLDIISAP
ncbi:6-phosphogluconolactonase [Granulosicoccaceae sp. 1_MG-2023]|nr:6-phosphogluconolactonase [Granulosicoccaceae sp. 1_MG-2023]